MVIPVVIFVVCVAAGSVASARWLPDLPNGVRGGFVFFIVCGLLGAAAGTAGLQLYAVIEVLRRDGGGVGRTFLAETLATMLWETGLLVAVATGLYALVPRFSAAAPPPEATGAGPPLR